MSSRAASIRSELLRAIAVVLEVLLSAAGLWILGDVYLTAMHSAYTQMAVRAELSRVPAAALTTPVTALPAAVSSAEAPTATPVLSPGSKSRAVGEMTIPRLRMSSAVLEGDSASNLRLGVAHLTDTPLPWQPGNSVYVGHRDTFFRALRDLRGGDEIVLATLHGTFTYRVRWVHIVDPDEVWVLDPALASLTLITCYPFIYVGSAPQRYVVQADRVDHPEIAFVQDR